MTRRRRITSLELEAKVWWEPPHPAYWHGFRAGAVCALLGVIVACVLWTVTR